MKKLLSVLKSINGGYVTLGEKMENLFKEYPALWVAVFVLAFPVGLFIVKHDLLFFVFLLGTFVYVMTLYNDVVRPATNKYYHEKQKKEKQAHGLQLVEKKK